MSASLKFKHINENGIKMLNPLISNETFLRYIKCLSDDPLNEVITPSELYSNIINTRSKDGNIVLGEFDETVLVESKIKIFFHPFEPDRFTEALYSDVYIFDILIPNEYTILEGKGVWRAYAIAYEVSKIIDNQSIAGLGKCEIIRYRQSKANNNYTGLRLLIKVYNASVGG